LEEGKSKNRCVHINIGRFIWKFRDDPDGVREAFRKAAIDPETEPENWCLRGNCLGSLEYNERNFDRTLALGEELLERAMAKQRQKKLTHPFVLDVSNFYRLICMASSKLDLLEKCLWSGAKAIDTLPKPDEPFFRPGHKANVYEALYDIHRMRGHDAEATKYSDLLERWRTMFGLFM